MICFSARPPAALILVAAAIVCGRLHAAEPAGLSLNQAIERALAASPELTVTARDAEARAGALQQAGARPRPEVGVLVENMLGTGRRSGIEAAESTLSPGLALERGARARRVAAALAGVEQAELEERLKRLEVGAETARRFIVVLQGQQALTNAREGTRLFEETATAVSKRVEAARAPLAEGARANAQLAQIRLAEEHAEHELASAEIRLAAMWGAREPDFAQVIGQLDPPPALIAFATLQQRLDGNGELARLLTEKRLREAELQLARNKARPPWHLTAGVRRFEDGGDHALLLGVTIPLASRDLVEGATAEARARSLQVDDRARASRIALEADFYALYQDLNHAYTELEIMDREVLPQIEQALEQTRYAYERGRYGYVEWLAVQRELLEARRTKLDALARLHQYRIEIERLTGATLGAEQ